MAMKTHDIYVVRKSWKDTKSQIKRATTELDEAIKICPEGYTVFNMRGEVVYNSKTKSLSNTKNNNVKASNYKCMWNDLRVEMNHKRDMAIYDIKYLNTLPLHKRVKLIQSYLKAFRIFDESTNILNIMNRLEKNYRKKEEENGRNEKERSNY